MNNPHEILKKYWGYDSFRSLQEEIVTSVLSGHDTLGMLPTGGGKSITFQVPGLALGGLTLVVTPLISLMKDQADHLIQRGIKAAAIYTGMTREEVQETYDKVIQEHYHFLYVSPERLQTQLFQMRIPYLDIRLLVVDEAHCISQWGYDFRPPYLKISEFRRFLAQECPNHPDVPCMALTATATPDVVKDICTKLQFRPGYEVHQASFVRPNLTYTVIKTEDPWTDMLPLLEKFRKTPSEALEQLETSINLDTLSEGSAIVYVRSRKKTQQIAEALTGAGIPATFYHAGLNAEQKQERQDTWMKGEIPVIVATNAFGMGIDKPNVRVVVHVDLPPSPEEYFQEAGRAGRDGLPATAYLLASPNGMAELLNHLQMSYPERDRIRMVYERLAYFYQIEPGAGFNCTFEFDLFKFCSAYRLQATEVYSSLKILTMAGYITYHEEPESRSRLMFTCSKESLYHLDRFDPECQRIITGLLRLYTGMFADFQKFSEDRIAKFAHMEREEVYQKLLLLSRFHVLHYVPARQMPCIYYAMPRLDTDEVRIPHTVYEDRMLRDKNRAEAMIDYAFNDDECRLLKLLHYFGEQSTVTCGKCDVCLSEHTVPSKQQEEDVRMLILSYLQNNGPTSSLQLLTKIGHPETVPGMLRQMLSEGLLVIEKNKVSIKQN